jgi:hypothetical protein
MDQNERRIIDDLFARLDEAERRAGPREAEAERLIQGHLGRQPAAPYYMAQVIVVQQDALANAEARIEQLERAASERPAGGFLGGLFGGGERPAPARRSPAAERRGGPGEGPWSQPYGRGGGFLAGAAQTAMGVAGGVLIADALGDLFAPDPAAAAEPDPLQEEPASGDELGADEGISDAGDLGFDEF